MVEIGELMILLERRTATGGNRWEVEALEIDPQRISSISSKLDTYRTYDFADLGDHEEEAFFRNSGYLKYKLGHDREGDHDHWSRMENSRTFPQSPVQADLVVVKNDSCD